METIYTITVFQKISHNDSIASPHIYDFGDRRCVGWFDCFEEANCAVENNFSDMRDDIYDYAIIEKMEPGILTVDLERVVYKWNEEKHSYEKIATPPELAHASNFGIG